MPQLTFSQTQLLEQIARLSTFEHEISVEDVRVFIKISTEFFKNHLTLAGYEKVNSLTTKFRDAGRRSPPWKPASAKVPGRPQDGADGNRRPRWMFDNDHKFYADEVNATLVEVKYIFQTLSMQSAPPIEPNIIEDNLHWLLNHKVIPGAYVDPIQLIPISFEDFINNPRSIQSGHLIPLDRGGKHIPNNAFLMLARSNQIQGNQTLDELIGLMRRIVKTHDEGRQPPEIKVNPTSES